MKVSSVNINRHIWLTYKSTVSRTIYEYLWTPFVSRTIYEYLWTPFVSRTIYEYLWTPFVSRTIYEYLWTPFVTQTVHPNTEKRKLPCVTTTYGAANDDKVGITTTLCKWFVHCHALLWSGTGAHFTNNLSITIQMWWKFHFALIQVLIKWSLQNLAHGTTAGLSWHVPNFVAIWSTVIELELNEFSIEFELWWRNR